LAISSLFATYCFDARGKGAKPMSQANTPEQKIAPKSLLRYRPIGEQKDAPGKSQARSSAPPVQRPSRLSNRTENESDATWKRPAAARSGLTGQQKPPLSALPPSHHTSIPRSSTPIAKKTRTTQAVRIHLTQVHPLLLLGLGMILMLLLWILVSTVFGWASVTLAMLRYGNPPTYQVDVYVGHNEHPGQPSHFIALNLHRHIEIIEIEGGDPAHTRLYPGPQLYGSQDNVTPATLSFITPKGKKYPDMILHIGNAQLTYTNNGQAFVSPLSSTP